VLNGANSVPASQECQRIQTFDSILEETRQERMNILVYNDFRTLSALRVGHRIPPGPFRI
jgi:hypothetical protein